MTWADPLSDYWEDAYCYTCDGTTRHAILYLSDHDFVGKLLKCGVCGETIKEPIGGRK